MDILREEEINEQTMETTYEALDRLFSALIRAMQTYDRQREREDGKKVAGCGGT